MKARIMYVNNNEKEGYAVSIYSDGEWGLDSFYPLVKRCNAREDEEKNFVHFGLINKIAELQAFGYKLIFK